MNSFLIEAPFIVLAAIVGAFIGRLHGREAAEEMLAKLDDGEPRMPAFKRTVFALNIIALGLFFGAGVLNGAAWDARAKAPANAYLFLSISAIVAVVAVGIVAFVVSAALTNRSTLMASYRRSVEGAVSPK